MSQKGTILFDISKNEMFQLTDNYKTFHRKIKTNFKVELNKADLDAENLKNTHLFVIAGPQDKFTEQEIKHLKDFVENGGRVMIMLGEGGESSFNTNINFFLEDYGIFINNDCVIRPHYSKNFHPKEAIVGGGIVCDSMWKSLMSKTIDLVDFSFSDEKFKIHFQYPYGASLNVVDPAYVLVTTGPAIYPFNRPLIGYYCNENNGKILAIGSGHMFQDKHLIDKSNDAMLDYFINLLTSDDVKFSRLDFNDIEINNNKFIPDTAFLAEQPRACLVESAVFDIPADYKKIFNMHLHSLNNNLLRDVIDTYKKLSVEYEPLKIIKPQFEIPLPPLQIAVFPPPFTDLLPPNLELFDLENDFSSTRLQVEQLTNKYLSVFEEMNIKKEVTQRDLEYFIKECGRIVSIWPDGQSLTAKEILYRIGVKIAQYKKLDRE